MGLGGDGRWYTVNTGSIYQKVERGYEQGEVDGGDGGGGAGAVTGIQGVKLEFEIGYSRWVL